MKSLLFTTLILLLINLINAHSYESLGIDAVQKKETEKIIEDESQFPVINISTKDNSELIISRENYTDSVVDVFNIEDKYRLKERSASVKLRGNSSSFYGDVKKVLANQVPYRIKFDKKTNLLGLHDGEKFKNWVLLKIDGDVIRNDVAIRMGKVIFDKKYFITDSHFVKLYINDVFKGIYLLTEHNEIDEKKVNISQPEKNYNGTDIGYYLELDNYFYENPGKYISLDYEKATVKDIRGEERKFVPAEYTIKNDIYCEEQLYFIGNYTKNVFNIIYQAIENGEYKTFDEDYNLVNSTFTSVEETISAVFDVESAVNTYLLYEIIHDYDVGEGSFFFAVDFSENSKIKKLQMVSPWDFNWAYSDSPRRYWAGAFCDTAFAKKYGDRTNPWFVLLAKNDWFHELVSKKWEGFSTAIRAQLVEENAYLYQNYNDVLLVGKSVFKGVDNLYTWINKRLDWIDEAFVPGKSALPVPDEKDPVVTTTTKPVETTQPVVTKTTTVIIEPTIDVETTESTEIDSDDEQEVTAEAEEEQDSDSEEEEEQE
ncbi:hypothetical protein BCR36DRAFT_585358 [Piromyces finnis]|uniref:Coth-domain-containing protein n=1 Tax=Piromyces finnis TaxID=1754191 RepID=A0A1Y1V358_9FUNG|nr:hypothetical protein BCR36DRAFT_585358 [Piromyces finnis]|eukprot:ORX46212.1 hypothetical protein BCR36DRAFT_585358 [Piromyces finnis]